MRRQHEEPRAMMIGTLVLDEQVLAIESVELREGRLWFLVRFPAPPPYELGESLDVRLHGKDGTLILATRIEWPTRREFLDVRPPSAAWLELPLRIESSLPGEPWARGPLT